MVRIWNSDDLQCVQVINTGCTVAALKLRCTHLAVGSFNASAMLWNRPAGEILGRYVGHTSAVFSVDFSWILDILVTGSADRTVILWSLLNKTPLHSIQTTFKPSSLHCVFSPQSSSFILAANDSNECEEWLVNFCNRNEIIVSPLFYLPIGWRSQAFVADFEDNEKLVIACAMYDITLEICISFKCSKYTSKNNSTHNSSELVHDPQGILDTNFRYTSLAVAKKLLLGTGSCFSAYMSQQGGNNELLIFRHSSGSPGEHVALYQLPNNCRLENKLLLDFYIALE